MADAKKLINDAKISVIVPCYNQAQYLSEALDSVLNQTYNNWECIIVNDGSQDNIDKVVVSYLKKDERFKYLKKENGGLSNARNEGIHQSTGKYILPLDADDKIGPQYIEKALEIFACTPDIALIYSQAKYFGLLNNIWILRQYSYKELLKSNVIFCSAIFKRADFDKTGGYDEQLRTGYEDWDLYIRLLHVESKVVQLKSFHFFYRVKDVSMLKSIDSERQKQLNNYLYNKHISIYQKYFDSPIDLLREIDLSERMYKNSVDYRLGNKIINPFRSIIKMIGTGRK